MSNPSSFNTYKDLERLNKQPFRYVQIELDDMKSFILGLHVESAGTFSYGNQNNKTVFYLDSLESYVIVVNTDSNKNPKSGIVTASIGNLNTEEYKRQINLRQEALGRSRLYGLGLSGTGHEDEINSLRDINRNLGAIKLTIIEKNALQTVHIVFILVFSILSLVTIFPAARTWQFFVNPAKSRVCRALATFGDVNTLFDECVESFGGRNLLYDSKVELSGSYIVLFKPSYVFVAPLREALQGHMDVISDVTYKRRSGHYKYRLNLSFSNGLEEIITVNERNVVEIVLRNLERMNPDFKVGEQRDMRSSIFGLYTDD